MTYVYGDHRVTLTEYESTLHFSTQATGMNLTVDASYDGHPTFTVSGQFGTTEEFMALALAAHEHLTKVK